MGLWVLWAALSWWVAPRQSDTAQARADLAAGRIEAYQWGNQWKDTNGKWTTTPTLQRRGGTASMLAWRTPYLRVHYANLDPADLAGRPSSVSTVDADDTTLGRALSAGASAARTADLEPIAAPMSLVLLLGGVVMLLVLVSHPEPVIGTRWFWFWTITGVPYGLGLLYWLAKERPWSTTAQPLPLSPTGRDPRRRWYHGLALIILSGIAISVLLYALRLLLGETLFPV